MFGRLRVKFITVSMLSVILVLGVIIAGINVLSYFNTVKDADQILEILADNEGRFPERRMEEAPSDPSVQQPQMRPQMMPERSPELAFESRYFSVLFDNGGSILSTDTGMIAAVDNAAAEEYARKVYEGSVEKGFDGDYRFIKVSEGENVRVIFYDCGRGLDAFRGFLKTSILISATGVMIVFILIFFASARIVRPVSDSYEKQKRFITDAGHEIKTPLAIINADADVILSEGENSWADDIKSQVGRLTELTNSLIFLSKMEEGLPEVSFTSVDLSEVTKDVCDSFASVFLTGNKDLETDIKDKILVRGDEKALKELVSILLDNASKYSPEGGTAQVSLCSTGKGAVLSVTNDTVGTVDKEDTVHLFDRFYRTDKSRSSQTGGHGIGLSIAKAIVTAHKGKITADVPSDRKLTVKVILSEG